MDPGFWHERWSRDEIGFHQHDYNRYMQEFTERMALPAGAHLLVPLCGKSRDMVWLADQGYRVTGIELSERAVRDFYWENRLPFELEQRAEGPVFHGDRITVCCADFFAVDPASLPPVDGVYDRAALVALPPSMRGDYVRRLARWTPTGAPTLLVTLEYPEGEMNGPPFSVPPDEVQALLAPWHTLEALHSEDCLESEPRFRLKGLTRLQEHVYLLQRKPDSQGDPACPDG